MIVAFDKLMQAVAFGSTDEDVLSSLAGRLARMEHRIGADDDRQVRQLTGGLGIRDLSHRIVAALDPDRHIEQARADLGLAPDDDRPIPEQALAQAREKVIQEAVKPLHDPQVREAIEDIKKKNEIVIDTVSADTVLEAGFSQDALDHARGLTDSFEQFTDEQRRWLEMIRDHIAANLAIEPDDFEYAPFAQEGGLGKVYQVFGEQLPFILDQLNEALAA